jgi:hypothetical protein
MMINLIIFKFKQREPHPMSSLLRASLLVGCILLASNSLFATTYYVDSSAGSDANNGTAKTSAWANAPGMTGCAKTCASYSPAPGDSIILKGGDTWQAGGNPNWSWTWSGSSSSPIYVGVDTTWYSGTNQGVVSTSGTVVTWVSGNAFQMNGSWTGGTIVINGTSYTIASVPNPSIIILTASAGKQTGVSYSNSLFKRPIIDAQGSANEIINAFASYVTFDSLEITGAMDQAVNENGSFNTGSSGGNVTLENADIHNFRYCTGNGTPTAYCTGALSDNSGSSGGIEVSLYAGQSGAGMTLKNSNVGSPESASESGTLFGAYGACSRGMQIVQSNYIHDCSQAQLHGGTLVSGNIIANVGLSWDGSTHTNGLYLDCLSGTCTVGSASGNLTSYVFNNWIQNMLGNASATAIYPNPGTSDGGSTSTVTYYVFNNVETNSGPGAAGQIGDEIDPYNAPSGLTMNVYDWNNTYELSSSLSCVNVVPRSVSLHIVDVRNLFCVESATPAGGVLDSILSAISPETLDVLGESISTANTQGYIAPTWQPTVGTGLTVGAGTNLSTYCSGNLKQLCSPTTLGGMLSPGSRSPSGAWDIGAYQFLAPGPPTNLTATAP